MRTLFAYISYPTAKQTIYLDFNGHTTTGTEWNNKYGTVITPPFDLDGSPASSNINELETIQHIWQRVAEDFAPFNVDVTTQEPPLSDLIRRPTNPFRLDHKDTRWGVRVAIGGSYMDWYGEEAGGVALLGSFNWNSDTPCFVFAKDRGNGNERSVADGISHEVGHTLGLSHDGLIIPPGTPPNKYKDYDYYAGHGAEDLGWNAIMGGKDQAVTQWSKGEYTNANNHEDDLHIITSNNGFGYRVDDHNGVADGTFLIHFIGNIETTGDVDAVTFDTNWGGDETENVLFSLEIAPRGPNLNAAIELYTSNGVQIAAYSGNGAGGAINFTKALAGGSYVIRIRGVGFVDTAVLTDPSRQGYSDYGSLGEYRLHLNRTGASGFTTNKNDAVRYLGTETLGIYFQAAPDGPRYKAIPFHGKIIGKKGSGLELFNDGAVQSFAAIDVDKVNLLNRSQLIVSDELQAVGDVLVDGQLDLTTSALIRYNTKVVVNGSIGGTGVIEGELLINQTGILNPHLDYGVSRPPKQADDSTIGRMRVNKLTIKGEYAVDIAGSSSDQVVAKGPVILNSSHLSLNVSGTIAAGQEFVIIKNDSLSQVSGQFVNLFGADYAEGAIVSGNFGGTGLTARIIYRGGDGNDVVIVVDGNYQFTSPTNSATSSLKIVADDGVVHFMSMAFSSRHVLCRALIDCWSRARLAKSTISTSISAVAIRSLRVALHFRLERIRLIR